MAIHMVVGGVQVRGWSVDLDWTLIGRVSRLSKLSELVHVTRRSWQQVVRLTVGHRIASLQIVWLPVIRAVIEWSCEHFERALLNWWPQNGLQTTSRWCFSKRVKRQVERWKAQNHGNNRENIFEQLSKVFSGNLSRLRFVSEWKKKIVSSFLMLSKIAHTLQLKCNHSDNRWKSLSNWIPVVFSVSISADLLVKIKFLARSPLSWTPNFLPTIHES